MRYILLTLLFISVPLIQAQPVNSRINNALPGVSNTNTGSRSHGNVMSRYNTPPSEVQFDTNPSTSSYRGVIPYRAYDNYRGINPSAAGVQQPLTTTPRLPVYPKTATGLNISNYPQSNLRLPYITNDRRGISSGMPEFDRYQTNKIIAQTYSPRADLRPFTENIQEFEYYLKERNFRTSDLLQQNRDLLSRKYMIDAEENMSIQSLIDPFGYIAEVRKESKYADKPLFDDEIDEESKEGDIFTQMLERQREAGLEAEPTTPRDATYGLDQTTMGLEGSRMDDKSTGVSALRIDLSDKVQLRKEARRILGEHTTFAGYADDKFNTYMKRAEDFMEQGEYYKAADAYSLAEIFRRNDPLVHAGKSLALLGAGEYMSSSFYLSRTLMLYPDYIAVKVNLVAMLGDRDVLENRIVDIQRWQARSGAGELSFLLAYIYYQMDEPQWAKEELERDADKLPFPETARLLAEMVDADIE